jgi:UDP-N-acetylmuramoyl-tripeptide--D-alanyl-D-alanine ligase
VIPLTLADIAAAVGGQLAAAAPDQQVTGPVVVDHRAVAPGGLFVAIPGERADGHDFAAAAHAAGAVAVLAGRPVDAPAVIAPDGDTVRALGRLARHVVDRLPATVIVGVTGSSGKTTTKDLLAQVLARSGPTIAPPGSYNNEIGLPLTALRAEPGTRHLVLEMGARGDGHIAALCAIAPPRVGVVLNVGSAHLGEFGGRAAIARAKAELVAALPPDGRAVLNADDELVRAMASRTPARVTTFGTAADADVRATDIRLDSAGRPRFVISCRGEAGGADDSAEVRLRLHGAHNVANALAAAAVALEAGQSLAEVAAVLSEAAPLSKWRMEVCDRDDGVTVVNDAYNANPESVRAALEALVAIAGGPGARRTWAVLGEMCELGADSASEHERIGRLAARLGVSRLVVVGEGAKPIHAGAGRESKDGRAGGDGGAGGAGKAGRTQPSRAFAPDASSAAELLAEQLRPGDVVLVKASRAAGLETVAQALLAGEGTACG